MPNHRAAVMASPRARLEIRSVPDPEPAPDEILVQVRAVGINPVDWVIQGTGPITYSWLKAPVVLGSDVAGEVVAVGSAVTRFRVGDRVVGLATGTDRGRDPLREGAFRERTVLLERLSAPIPNGMPEERAAVLPLGVSTAACALFQTAHLGLPVPGDEGAASGGGVVIIWGGATSVGMNAIQLARAAGYAVITTASQRNALLLLELGAETVIDRTAPDAVGRLVTAVGGRRVVGAVALGAGSAGPCIDVLRRTGGKILAMASTPVSLEGVAGRRRLFPGMIPTFTRIGVTMGSLMLRARRAGIRAGFVWGSSLRDDGLGERLWGGFLPAALADGSYRAVPEPLTAGSGLDAVQAGLDRQREGVSAQKIVIAIDWGARSRPARRAQAKAAGSDDPPHPVS